MMFQGTLQEIITQMEPIVATHPRREPGVVNWDGVTLRYVDLHSFYYQALQIFGEGLYKFEPSRKAPRIIDCGAHIGLATLFFRLNYPDARLTGFEADPDIFEALRENMKSIGLGPAVVRQQAVWVDNDGVRFNASADDSGAVSDQGTDVPSMRLRDLLAEEEQVDLLKMDIEGAEYDVINDCADVLHKVDRMIIEAHVLGDPANSSLRLGGLLKVLEDAGARYVLGDLHPAMWIEGASKPPFKSFATDRFICTVFAWRA